MSMEAQREDRLDGSYYSKEQGAYTPLYVCCFESKSRKAQRF